MFPFLLKAGIKHCNDLRMKFVVYVRSKSKEQNWGETKLPTHTVGKLPSQWQKEHVSTTVTLQKEHYFYSQFSKI